MDDRQAYERLQKDQEQAWEDQCNMCGACCGSLDGDPCEHLTQRADGTYFCDIYTRRWGEHKTISGKVIRCVDIRKLQGKSWPGSHQCGYFQEKTL
jgi:hypothetical protein